MPTKEAIMRTNALAGLLKRTASSLAGVVASMNAIVKGMENHAEVIQRSQV